jgi:hypothetical protein
VSYEHGRRGGDDPPPSFVVNDAALADPWFARTGFTPGSVLFDLGYEWDAAAPSCLPGELTVLFHYGGTPSNADAVKYVAPSGARVFSAGSIQFS